MPGQTEPVDPTSQRAISTIIAWGGMQAVALQMTLPQSGINGVPTHQSTSESTESHTIQLLGRDTVIGYVVWSTPEGSVAAMAARWHETGGPGDLGCSFTDARLHLTALQTMDADGKAKVSAVTHQGLYLYAAYRAQAALQSRQPMEQLRPALDSLLHLATTLPPTGVGDKDLAQRFLASAQRANALRQRAAALVLYQAASTLYRRIADQHPEDAAFALSHHAAMQYRLAGWSAASQLIEEGLSLLDNHQLVDSEAASTLLGQLGSWQLNAGEAELAQRSFARAAQIDKARAAPPLDRALSLSNLASAFAQNQQAKQALVLFDEALQFAQRAEAGNDDQVTRGAAANPKAPTLVLSIVDFIRDNIATLEATAPSTHRISGAREPNS
jgi:tetratricopeptide (TPR) repeat protein